METMAGTRRIARLTFIPSAREVGFTLREIRELIGGFPGVSLEAARRRL